MSLLSLHSKNVWNGNWGLPFWLLGVPFGGNLFFLSYDSRSLVEPISHPIYLVGRVASVCVCLHRTQTKERGNFVGNCVSDGCVCSGSHTAGCEAAGENKINVHHDAVCVNLCELRFRPSLSCTQSVKRWGEVT